MLPNRRADIFTDGGEHLAGQCALVRAGNEQRQNHLVAQNRGTPEEPTLTKPAVAGGNDVELRLSGMFRSR